MLLKLLLSRYQKTFWTAKDKSFLSYHLICFSSISIIWYLISPSFLEHFFFFLGLKYLSHFWFSSYLTVTFNLISWILPAIQDSVLDHFSLRAHILILPLLSIICVECPKFISLSSSPINFMHVHPAPYMTSPLGCATGISADVLQNKQKLLGYMIVLFLVLQGISILPSLVAVPFYSLNKSVRLFPFFHTLSTIYCL